MRSAKFLILILAVAFFGYGCAAANVALQYKDLDVQTKMSATVFRTPIAPEKKTVWVEVNDTSDKSLALDPLRDMLVGKGYRVVADPEQAHYWLQVNVLYVGKADPSALEKSLYAGWGGPLAGLAVGASIGAGVGGYSGLGFGGLAGMALGGIAEMVAGSLVKKVTFTVITDVQLSEKSDKPVSQSQAASVKQGSSTTIQQNVQEVTDRKLYRTRVVSTATKVNLEFEEARPHLTSNLVRSLAGIL